MWARFLRALLVLLVCTAYDAISAALDAAMAGPDARALADGTAFVNAMQADAWQVRVVDKSG